MRGKITRAVERKVEEENRKLHDHGAHNYDNYPPYHNRQIFTHYALDAAYIRGLFPRTPLVLDAGCGTGHLAREFIKAGCRVDVNDISPEMVRVTLARISRLQRNTVSHTQDVNELLERLARGRRQYDVICFSSMLHHVVDYVKSVRLATKLLRPGGIIYIVGEPMWFGKGGLDRSSRFAIWASAQYINAYKAVRNPRYAIRFIREQYLRRKSEGKPEIDIALAEYHGRTGLDHERILRTLRQERCVVLSLTKYTVHPGRAVRLLDPLLSDRSRTFKLIAIKTA